MAATTRDQPARMLHPRSGWNVWAGAAVALGVVALGLLVAVFLTTSPTSDNLYAASFLVLLLAAVSGVAGWVRGHGQRLGFRPGSALGWWALGLLAFGLVLATAPDLVEVTGPANRTLTELILLGFGVLFASAVVALVAVLRQGERSLPVIALCLFAGLGVVYFLFGELALPH